MNRLVTDSTAALDPAALPPARREAGGPARVLFLHSTAVGFATTTANLEHYTAHRADIDAVHIRVVMPKWYRWVCKQSPVPVGELDFRYLRHMLASRWFISRLIGPGSRLPLDRFDVVHIMTQQRGTALLDYRTPKTNPTGTKFAVNLDATLANWESMRGHTRLAPRFDHALEGRTLRSADLVACASNWCASSCTDALGVDPAKIVLHRPCARVMRRDQSPLAQAPGPLNILFIGGDWIDKGGPRLLRWHQERWKTQAVLHVVSGSAPRDDRAANVVWHGRVPHERLINDLLPSADLLVVPTKWDTFLIAAQEAQAAGVPVVSTQTGAVGEVVVDGVTGFLCPRDDDQQYIAAVEKLLTDGKLRTTMGAAAAEHAARHLSADVWHNHLLDQLVALADGRALRREPYDRGPAALNNA